MRLLILLSPLLVGPAVAAEPPCRGGGVNLDTPNQAAGNVLSQLATTYGVAVTGPLPQGPAPDRLAGDIVEVFGRLLRGTSHAVICVEGRPARILILGEAQGAAAPVPPDGTPRWTPRDD